MQNYVSRFRLPNGKWAYIQHDDLAATAKEHLQIIKCRWNSPEYFFHLRSGGHVAALRHHQASTWFGKLDLSSFFHHITRHRLVRCLEGVGYSFRDADDFAVASTVCVDPASRRFALPYGFVQSPLLASIALDQSDLGNCLRRLNSAGSCTVSVYVDDIIVSANTEEEVAAALFDIREAARKSNFPINEAKSRDPSKSLHAFNIDVDTHAMEVTGERYQEMCEEVLVNGAGPISEGILGYVRSVSPVQAEQMQRDFPRSFPYRQL